MADSDELHDLVSALTMQEKRHFKLFAQRYGEGKSNYIVLFNAMSSQQRYDEQKLKRKLKDTSVLRHLPFEKHRLATLIRRSLRLYHHGKTVDLALKEMLVDAEILHEKSLYTHCRKMLRKARETARRYERFAFIPEITRLESRLFDIDKLDDVYQEESEALEKMQIINEYRRLSNQVAGWIAKSHQVRSAADILAFDRLMKMPLMRTEARADTFTARVYFFYIQSVYHEMKGNSEGAYASRKRFIQLTEADTAQKEIHIKNYLSALNNLAVSELGLRKYADARATVQKIKDIALLKGGRAEDVRVSSFVFSTILSLNIAIRTGDFTEAYKALPQIEKELSRHDNKIQPQFLVVIHNSIKHVCFGAGEYRKALQWSNRVINEADKHVRQDIQATSRIFNLLLHYEMGNTELLDYIIRSTYRYLLKSNRLYKVETIVLQYLRKYAHAASRREILLSFRKLYDQLLPLSRDPYEKKAFEDFDLLAWLQSKIETKKFEAVVRAHCGKSLKKQGSRKNK